MRYNRYQQGQSLLELLLAMGIFVLVISGVMLLTMDAHVANLQGAERIKAALLAQEAHEAVRSIQERGWKYLIPGTHGLISDPHNYWEFAKDSDTVESYTRQVTVEPVARDENGAIVANGGVLDFDTKKVTTSVRWDFQPNRPSEVVTESYLSNWRSLKWIQTSQSDFNPGTKTNTVAANGQVQLARQDGTKTQDWTFDKSGEYQYDPAKIKIFASQAALVGSGTIIASGQTSNSGFDNNLNSWNYATWDRQTGEPTFSGTRLGSGGNPGGWARVRFVAAASQTYQTGGFFQQQFLVSADAVTTASLHLDWQVQQIYGGTVPVRAKLYAFISRSAGEPQVDSSDQVWTTDDWLTSASGWAAVDVNVTDYMQQQGTYYLKLAVWVEGGSGTNAVNIGFDNARVSWQKSAERYPTDNPTVQPIQSFAATDVRQWTSFTEKADKNGGEIYYQLSDNDGMTWQYWNGSRWRTVRNPRDYTTAADINAHIGLFPAGNQHLMFKAFLSSNGTQLVTLDNVQIGYLASGGGPYYASGRFVSTAFDTSVSAPIYNYVNWTATVPNGTSVRFQLRTAPQQGDLSGASWVGPDGSSASYFTTAGQTVPGDAGQRWVQYQAYFSTTDGAVTPVLHDFSIDYE